MKRNMEPAPVAFPTPVYIVGTYGDNDEPTAMNAAWGGICSSEPPCIMVAIRKARYTYSNIMKHKEFTINIPDAAHVKEADYLGLISGTKVNKFEACGLTAVKGAKVNAPVINEFPLALECRLYDTMETDSHVVMIGEIVNVAADEDCINEKGVVDAAKVDPMMFDPTGRTYNRIGEVAGKAFSAGIGFLPEE